MSARSGSVRAWMVAIVAAQIVATALFVWFVEPVRVFAFTAMLGAGCVAFLLDGARTHSLSRNEKWTVVGIAVAPLVIACVLAMLVERRGR